jgi:hypothetical protein
MQPSHASCRATVMIALLAAVAACAGGPQVATGPQANPSAARGLLAATSARGPVPLVLDEVPAEFVGGPAQVAGTASNSVAWLGASFAPAETAPLDERRVVFRFNDAVRDPEAVCADSETRRATAAEPLQLFAVFCDGGRPVTDATGTASGTGPAAADQLVAAVTDRLFPGNSTTGYSNAVPGVSLGVGVGSGGDWGLGTGLFF